MLWGGFLYEDVKNCYGVGIQLKIQCGLEEDWQFVLGHLEWSSATHSSVCVRMSLSASHYHTEKFFELLCRQRSRRGNGGVGRAGGKERVCLRKNNKLPLIWLLAHPLSPLSLLNCITAEREAASHPLEWDTCCFCSRFISFSAVCLPVPARHSDFLLL